MATKTEPVRAVKTTTIRIDAATHERLVILAEERGLSIKQLVDALVADVPTGAELRARQAAAANYVREHLNVELSDDDLTAGETFWQDLAAGRVPENL
jgi:hypothetical protein